MQEYGWVGSIHHRLAETGLPIGSGIFRGLPKVGVRGAENTGCPFGLDGGALWSITPWAYLVNQKILRS